MKEKEKNGQEKGDEKDKDCSGARGCKDCEYLKKISSKEKEEEERMRQKYSFSIAIISPNE